MDPSIAISLPFTLALSRPRSLRPDRWNAAVKRKDSRPLFRALSLAHAEFADTEISPVDFKTWKLPLQFGDAFRCDSWAGVKGECL